MSINFYKKRIFNFLTFPIVLYLALFEINILNKEIKSEKKLMAATEKDLYLYKGMGASYLCIASKAGIEFPKALGVASATFASVVSQKHGGKIIEKKKEQTVDMKQLQFIASLQLVESALQVCPDNVPENIEKQFKIETERLKKLQGL